MRIGGFQKLSLIDYPRRLSAIVWTVGCNFRCVFCYNPELVLPEKVAKITLIPEEIIFSYLSRQRKFIDGVVITGGEPTIHEDLPMFIRRVKDMGYLVKLDTNGTNPMILKKLISGNLIDYIAMDVKAPVDEESYKKICRVKIEELIPKIDESINVIMSSNVEYEFRTTLVPNIHSEEAVSKIARSLSGAKLLVLQKFKPGHTLNKTLSNLKTQSDREMERMVNIAKRFVKKVVWR